jgi:hypothetical protein
VVCGKANTPKLPITHRRWGLIVPNKNAKELEGITLRVYLYIVKKGKQVGPRDVMKGLHLSSPSVAYRHLQKLEDLGYLKKNKYGEYLIKDKAPIKGSIWIGYRLLSKMLVYSVVFLGILVVELFVFAIHFQVESYVFKVFFILLIIVTGFALGVFTIEGLLQRRKTLQSFKG